MIIYVCVIKCEMLFFTCLGFSTPICVICGDNLWFDFTVALGIEYGDLRGFILRGMWEYNFVQQDTKFDEKLNK